MSDGKQGGLVMRFNLFALHKQLELAKGQKYAWTDIARATGLHHNTLYNLADNRTRRVDLGTLEKVLAYFQQEGLTIEAGDLFTVTTEPADQVPA